MPEELQLRIHGDASLPTLIYLPGLHGDWTLVGGFLQALDGRVRFVEITYPRTLDWSLDDYAAAIETALAENGIMSGWLLGESFGSQPLWALVARRKFAAQGVILAGGFVKHPDALGRAAGGTADWPDVERAVHLDHFQLRENCEVSVIGIRRECWRELTNLSRAGRIWTAAPRSIGCI